VLPLASHDERFIRDNLSHLLPKFGVDPAGPSAVLVIRDSSDPHALSRAGADELARLLDKARESTGPIEFRNALFDALGE
jgi:hypothetical protein